VPAGFAFLIGRPRLWPLAALPALLALLLALAGGVAGVFAAPRLDEWLDPQREARGTFGLMFAAALWTATPLAAALLGFGLALLLSAPLLDRVSVAVERLVTGEVRDSRRGVGWEIWQSLRGAAYFTVRTPLLLLAALVPFVGPLLAAGWGAHALAFGLTEAPLARQGLDFFDRRVWHRRFRAESLGFGLVGLATLFVPLANLLVAPALTVGATRLALDLLDYEREAGLPPPPEVGA
jgi:CysZ protein